MIKRYFTMIWWLFTTTIRIFWNKISLDFYRRYIVLMFLELTMKWVSIWTKNHISMPLIRLIKKPFLFDTPFGVYVWSSVDARARMRNNYESWIKKCIIKNHQRYKTDKHEVYFVNIWSNQWRWAIELAKSFDYHVIAFEAVPSIFNELMANVYLSWLPQMIKWYNLALWNYDGTVSFQFMEEHEGKSHVDVKTRSNQSLLRLPIQKFDTVKLDINYDNIKLFLIDVEWYEYEVLKGMEKTLRQLKEAELIIEIFDDNPDRDQLFQFMDHLGFDHKRITSMDYDYLFIKR